MSNSKRERFQSMGTAIALIMSVAALFISIYEANLLKSQQTSMVWPYLDMTTMTDYDGFRIELSNKGTGPAIITSVQVDFKGEPIENIDILMDSLNPQRTFGYDVLINSTIGNQVLMSGERRIAFGLPHSEESKIVFSNLDKLRLRIGYKSVLDEYWLYDSKDGSHEKTEFKATKEFKN